MADVQLEQGYARIAHPIVEGMAAASFSAAQFKILMHVVRETYGWGRKSARISQADFQRATALSINTVRVAVHSLLEAGVLVLDHPPSFDAPAEYSLQKDPTRWGRYAVHPPSLAQSPATPEGDPHATWGPHPEMGTPSPMVLHSPSGDGDPSPSGDGDPQQLTSSAATTSKGVKKDERKRKKEYPTHTPRTRARTRIHARGVDALTAFLGSHGDAVHRMAESAAHPPTWAAGIIALYGPGGTDERIWGGLSPPDRAEALAVALDRYAAEAKPYNGRLFRRFLETVIDERSRNGHGRDHGGGAARAPAQEARRAGVPARGKYEQHTIRSG